MGVLARVQRARRFARDLDGAADFDHLPMSKGKIAHLCSRVNLGADSLEDRRRVAVDLPPAVKAESRRPGTLL